MQLGYEAFGEAGIPGRYYYRKRAQQNFNLAIVQYAGELWQNNLAFRDYLRRNPRQAAMYAQVKQQIANGHDRLLDYSQHKRYFIAQLMAEALAASNSTHA